MYIGCGPLDHSSNVLTELPVKCLHQQHQLNRRRRKKPGLFLEANTFTQISAEHYGKKIHRTPWQSPRPSIAARNHQKAVTG